MWSRPDLSARSDILSVKAPRRRARLDEPGARADRAALPPRRRAAAGHPERRARASLEDLGEEEDAAEAGLGVHHIIEVYAPVVAAGQVLGAYDVYADARPFEASIAGRKRIVWLATAAVFLALWVLLLLLARTASETLRRQTPILRERSVALGRAYEQLETNALEAIETLSATVEAKDPYTVGHSHRVQPHRPRDRRRDRASAPRSRRASARSALPRHRQDRRAGRHPHEARVV